MIIMLNLGNSFCAAAETRTIFSLIDETIPLQKTEKLYAYYMYVHMYLFLWIIYLELCRANELFGNTEMPIVFLLGRQQGFLEYLFG